MKQPEDQKTLELALAEQPRGRGRPAKADALTPAQRAKRYRDAKRAETGSANKRDEKAVTANTWSTMISTDLSKRLQVQLDLVTAERDAAMKMVDQLENEVHNATRVADIERDVGNEKADRNIALQEKFDLEHMALVEAQNRIATLEAEVAKPKVNPLAAEVRKLKKALVERDLQHALIVRAMRDEFDMAAASRK